MKGKDSSWDECCFNSHAITISADGQKAKSLVETAKARVDFIKKSVIDGANARFVFEAYYTSAVEMLHALTILEGFKVENHICLGFYIRDILKNEELFLAFDRCRFNRNSVVYYGKAIDKETAILSIAKAKKVMQETGKLIEEKLRK